VSVHTRDWWPGKKVLLPSEWIDQVKWPERTVMVSVARDQVENAAQWNSGQRISSSFEDQLSVHYAK
jgi:hypothetical protein